MKDLIDFCRENKVGPIGKVPLPIEERVISPCIITIIIIFL